MNYYLTRILKNNYLISIKNRERILKKVLELEKYPELGKHLIGMDIWSLRIGKYWVLYRVKYH